MAYLCRMSAKKNIRHLTLQELKDYFEEIGDKKFRAIQVYEWLWKNNAQSFEDMSNLSKELRQLLSEKFVSPGIGVSTQQISSDGTIKTRFETFDNCLVEGVLIPTENRITACISSQVGCSLNCAFCATGKMDLKRNLDYIEIYNQVAVLNNESEKIYDKKLSNVVFMGMGEPLLNYNQVLKAIDRITATDGMAMSPRRITVSTAGIAKQIKKLGDDNVKFNLALSLHAADDKKRSQIMPINDSNKLSSLIEALNYFYAKTKNDITLEYILFKDINDSLLDADHLIKIYRQIPTHLINIIEYNPIGDGIFTKPEFSATQAFSDYLAKHRVNVRLRKSRGKDIDAACGQLANKGNL